MNPRVTMAVVAKHAGVHATTVSLALRNHPSLPEETRKRLQKLAAQMGYQRDPALSALVAYRRQARPLKNNPLLAYLTHWDSRFGWKEHAAHRDFFLGASRKATDLGYQLEHFWLGEENLTHRRMSRILYSRGITGLIIASHRREYDDALELDWSKFSGVKIDFSPVRQPLHIVTNDQRTIIALAVQRALAAGYRRIGFVMPRWWDQFVGRAWSAGFLAEQQDIPAPERVPILYFGDNVQNASVPGKANYLIPREPLAAWLNAHRPDVVLSHGRFVLDRFRELGLAVPRDLAFGEIFLEDNTGATAGVRQNCDRVGEIAVEILTGQMHQHVYGVPTIPTSTLVEGTWFDGASMPTRVTGAAPALPETKA